ncbi:hypothetical protein ACFFGF_04890 [Asaia lannensis]|nr:hypothetical protein AA102526_2715 [Asaia lannensis NBRC 102526]
MDDPRSIALKVMCPAPGVRGEILMVEDTWRHIQERHPEAIMDDISHTLQFPVAVHQDAKKQNSVLVTGSCMLAGTDNSMRVSVKTGCPDGNFVQTAHYSRDKVRTTRIWPESEEGNDE